MNIIVAGGSGFIGGTLTDKLLREGYKVTLLTRDPSRTLRGNTGLLVEQWDAKTVGSWGDRINGTDAVINLTGELIGGKRWTAKQKKIILESRVNSTHALVEAIAKALVDHPDQVQVRAVEGEQVTVLELRVHPEDLGKVIGRQGRTAKSMRTILGAAGMKIKKRLTLEILE